MDSFATKNDIGQDQNGGDADADADELGMGYFSRLAALEPQSTAGGVLLLPCGSKSIELGMGYFARLRNVETERHRQNGRGREQSGAVDWLKRGSAAESAAEVSYGQPGRRRRRSYERTVTPSSMGGGSSIGADSSSCHSSDDAGENGNTASRALSLMGGSEASAVRLVDAGALISGGESEESDACGSGGRIAQSSPEGTQARLPPVGAMDMDTSITYVNTGETAMVPVPGRPTKRRASADSDSDACCRNTHPDTAVQGLLNLKGPEEKGRGKKKGRQKDRKKDGSTCKARMNIEDDDARGYFNLVEAALASLYGRSGGDRKAADTNGATT